MQKRRLCKRRQRLVQTHNHGVRPKAHRIFRESGSESEVGSVRFIDDQRRPVCMAARCNRRDVRHDPLISRGCEDHDRNIRNASSTCAAVICPCRSPRVIAG